MTILPLQVPASFRYFFLLAVLIVGQGYAQTYNGAIRGSITDSAGSAILNASLTLTDEQTHQTRNTQSDSVGAYAFNALKPSTYSLHALVEIGTHGCRGRIDQRSVGGNFNDAAGSPHGQGHIQGKKILCGKHNVSAIRGAKVGRLNCRRSRGGCAAR